jgi:hypothetical protein
LLTYNTLDYISEYLGYKVQKPCQMTASSRTYGIVHAPREGRRSPSSAPVKGAHRVSICVPELRMPLKESGNEHREEAPMTEVSRPEFTTEELLSGARGNAAAFVLATIAYLKERGMDVQDFVAFFGRQFAPGWDELRAQPVADVALTVARNAVSVGCTLGSLSGDETRADVLVTGWPDAEALSSVLGLEPDAGDAMWDSFYPIMESLGIRYAWRREDGSVRLTFERENS